ncbi:MAG: type II toxin-antitoxin system RelE/ParE family toxin [Acidobacteriota bacterium]
MSRFLLTETAEGDLEEILAFIVERDGVGRAEHVLGHFLDAFDNLAASPRIGHRKRYLTGDALRWWPVFRFLVLYDPDASPLTVMRIVHGARDLDQIFGGTPRLSPEE